MGKGNLVGVEGFLETAEASGKEWQGECSRQREQLEQSCRKEVGRF